MGFHRVDAAVDRGLVFMTLSWGRPKAFWHEADSKPGELLPSKTDHIKQLLWLNRFSDLTPFGSIDGGFHGSHGDHTHTHTHGGPRQALAEQFPITHGQSVKVKIGDRSGGADVVKWRGEHPQVASNSM